MDHIKRLVASTAVAIAAFAGVAGQAMAHDHRYDHRYDTRGDHRGDHIDERQQRQMRAIRQGEETGRLTPRETHRLLRQQEHIRRAEARARADGHVSYRERERIDAMQDRARQSIDRQSRDDDRW